MIIIAINGFGRIGKTFLRALLSDQIASKKVRVVAINVGPDDPSLSAYLFKYDTLMGTYPGKVTIEHNVLSIDGYNIDIFNERDPEKLPWKNLGVDWVIECTGLFTARPQVSRHLQAGAKKVLISGPAQDEDVTIILGINEHDYNDSVTIVSLGSCTTNALVPVLKVLDDYCGVEKAFMTTVHAYTNAQVLLDVGNDDARRSRAAALNIVPTSSGATSTLRKVLPHLVGKVDGCALRIPLAKVSLIDVTFEMKNSYTALELNEVFKKSSEGSLKNILAISYEALVSSDFNGNSNSVIVDASLTQTIGNMGKVFGWYDNEWGYSQRIKDFLMQIT